MNNITKSLSKNWGRFILLTLNMLKLSNSITLISKAKCTSTALNRKRKRNQNCCKINRKRVRTTLLTLGLMISLMISWCFAPRKTNSKKAHRYTFVTEDFPINFCFSDMESLSNTTNTIIYFWESTSRSKHPKSDLFIT